MMTKGEYWIGDLCYVIDDRWDDVCSLLFKSGEKKKSERPGEFEMEDGIKFALYSTAWGDGCYDDNKGNRYGVDAGVIGCIKVSDLHKMGESPSTLGTVHTFEEDFVTGYDEGTIFFGDIRIETDPKSDEEDDDTCSGCGNPTYSLACHCDGWDEEEEK
jgi:hypothetical protein